MRSDPLHVPTPDGTGQAVHPDVLHVPGGFAGYTHWMACTPYPFADDRAENPVVRVSHDGLLWFAVPGAPDPLVAAPVDRRWHHADTDLVLHGGRLHLFYISTNREAAETTFSWMSSTDGVEWTDPRVVYAAEWGVSPSVVVGDDDTWHLWYVWRDSLARQQQSVLYRRRGSSPDAWGEAEPCRLRVPGHVVWHLDVIACDAGHEAVVAAFPEGTDPSRCRLFHATSADGVHFELTSTRPWIRPSWWGWDNRMVYRSTFTKDRSGSYRVWYSAASWGMRCGIGYLEGPREELRPQRVDGVPAVPWTRRLREDASGLSKYALFRLLPRPLFDAIAAAARGLRSRTRSA